MGIKLSHEFLALMIVAILVPFSILSGLTTSPRISDVQQETYLTLNSLEGRMELILQEMERKALLLGKRVEDMKNNPQRYENLFHSSEFVRIPAGAYLGIFVTLEEEGAMYVPNYVKVNPEIKRILGLLKNMNPYCNDIALVNTHVKLVTIYLENGISYTHCHLSPDELTPYEMLDEITQELKTFFPEFIEGTPFELVEWLIIPIFDSILENLTIEKGMFYLKILYLFLPITNLLFPDIARQINEYTESFIPSDWSGKDYSRAYQLAAPSNNPEKKVIWGPLSRDLVGGKWRITCSAPLYDKEGAFFGLISLGIDPALLTEEAVSTKLGETGYVFLMNEEGKVLAYPRTATKDLNLPLLEEKTGFFFTAERSERLANVSLLDHPNPEFTELLKTSLNGSVVRQKVSLGGTDRYVVLSPLPKLGWVIGGIVPYKEILAPVRDHILIAGVIAIVACAIATFWMQGRVAFSFSRISKASSEIVGGNLGSRIEPEMPIHEFRQVSKNINQIVDTLQATITTLQEKTDSLIQREKELKEARAYAQAIVANVADPLWVIDRRGNLVLMNEAMGRITGYEHEELQDKSMLALPIFRTFIAVMDGKDKLKQLIEQVNSGEHVPEVFIPWLTKGGDMLMMSCSGESLRNVEGNAVGGVFIGKDIYALQRTGVDAMKTLSQEIEAKVGKDYELATLAFMVNSTLIIGEAALDILKGTISGYNKRFSKSVEIQKGMILKNLKHEEWPKFLEFLLERFYECIGPTTFDSAEGIVALESAINKVKNKYKSAGAT